MTIYPVVKVEYLQDGMVVKTETMRVGNRFFGHSYESYRIAEITWEADGPPTLAEFHDQFDEWISRYERYNRDKT